MADVQFKDFADGTPAGDNILLQQDTGTGVYTKFLSSLITTTLQQAFDASVAASDSPTITSATPDGSGTFSIEISDTTLDLSSTFYIDKSTLELKSEDDTANESGRLDVSTSQAALSSGNRTNSTSSEIAATSAGDIVISSSINSVNIYSLTDAIDDAAAAAAGVLVSGLYHNAGVVRIRIT